MEEISRLYKVEPKEAYKMYKFLSKKLGLKIAPAGAVDYLPRFSTELGLDMSVQMRAQGILKMPENKIVKRSPKVLAAAALYLAARESKPVTQRKIVSTLSISEVSLRKASRELKT